MTAPDALADAVDPRLSRFEAESPGAARLAELASLAVRVDTGLLRRLRQTLLPDTDVGAESDLWFSAIVEARSETGFQIAPEITAQLRDRLKSMPDRPSVAAVRAILREAHATVSPAIRLEEEINGIALELGDAGRESIDEALRSALATLARGGTEAIDVGRWAMLAIPRLHPIVRDTKNARTLIAAASLLLRRRVRFSDEAPEPNVRISTLGWAVSGTPRSQRIGVEFVPGGVQFRGSVDAAAAFIDVPITDPVMVEIEWESPTGSRYRLTQAGDGVLVPLDGEPQAVTITTLLGDQFSVTSVVDVRRGVEQTPATQAVDATPRARPTLPVRVYYVYMHRDQAFRDQLEKHLSVLRRQGRIETLYERRIDPGTTGDDAIAEELNRAEIILLLLSADFLASDYINGGELRRALERAATGAASVIPILLRPALTEGSPLSHLQMLPRNGKAITTLRSRDKGWAEVVRGIDQVVEQIRRGVAAEARPGLAVLPPDALLAACVQIEPLGRGEAIGVAFAVEPSLLIGVRDNIEPLPIVGVHGDARQLQIIPWPVADKPVLPSDGGLVGLRPVGINGTVYATTLPPETSSDVEALRAAAAGFVDEEAKWFDVALEPHVAGRQARGVLFDPPDLSQEELEASFIGAPLVVNQHAVGVIVGVTRPQGHDTYATIEFADAPHLQQVIDRARRAVQRDETPKTGPRVFISYSPEDRDAAVHIRDTLMLEGFDAWLDIATIRPGERWRQEIERALDRSDLFLAILSTKAVERDESTVRAEWELAISRQVQRGGAFLVPIVIDDLSPSDDRVPAFLRTRHWAFAPAGKLTDNVIAMLRQSSVRAEPPTVDESQTPSERYSIDIAEILLPAIVRDSLAELLRSGRTPILVISGPPQSPIDEVVRFVQQKGDTDVERTIVELVEWRSDYSSRDLAEEIAASAGLSVDKIPGFEGSSDLRAARDIAAWLVSALESTGAARLLTIRGFERAVMQQDVSEVISQLIVHITQSKGLLRLLLLNYSAPLPATTESRVRRITLEPVNRRDVQHFFTTLFEKTGRAFEAAAIEQATESVFLPFASFDSWEYEDLRKRLAEAAQALTEA